MGAYLSGTTFELWFLCYYVCPGAQLVAQGIAHFFTHMALDLQGIELRQPVLQLHPGDTSDSNEGDLLEISMKTRLRGFPPLNMQF